jgi:hypothetical protein
MPRASRWRFPGNLHLGRARDARLAGDRAGSTRRCWTALRRPAMTAPSSSSQPTGRAPIPPQVRPQAWAGSRWTLRRARSPCPASSRSPWSLARPGGPRWPPRRPSWPLARPGWTLDLRWPPPPSCCWFVCCTDPGTTGPPVQVRDKQRPRGQVVPRPARPYGLSQRPARRLPNEGRTAGQPRRRHSCRVDPQLNGLSLHPRSASSGQPSAHATSRAVGMGPAALRRLGYGARDAANRRNPRNVDALTVPRGSSRRAAISDWV